MKISQDGDRPRFYAERKQLAARQGNPIHEGVSEDTRRRIIRELESRSRFKDAHGRVVNFTPWFVEDLNRVFVRSMYRSMPRGFDGFHSATLESNAVRVSTDHFLQIVEIWAVRIISHRESATQDLEIIQSLLADDLSAFRLVSVGTATAPRVQIQRIDNEHLHTVLTDRTFELTRIAEFASAQGDYADAWKHYSSGHLDDALTNAHKAVESACKNIIKRIDPISTPDNMQLKELVDNLARLKILPEKLPHMCGQLEQIFRNAGTLRNQPGAAHGSLDPTSPDASVTLLGLRMSGTLIAFLAERWAQMGAVGAR